MRLSAEGVELGYDRVVIATDLTLTIPDGQVSVLIGPNGCGKSTALRALSRLLKPRRGAVLLDGKAIHSFSTKEVAGGDHRGGPGVVRPPPASPVPVRAVH